MMNHSELKLYCLAKRGATEDLPFGPDTLVFKVLGKMFALTGTDPNSSTVNLKCDPMHAVVLRDTYPDDVKPGYHMNKKHWNTVTLKGAVSDDELREMIDESYRLVVSKLTKAEQLRLEAMI